MGEFRMPSLGADMEAGTLIEWHVKPGDAVKRGQIVALVETQKGIVEVEIWESGIVESLDVQPGAQAPVGTVLAKIRTADAGPVVTPEAPREHVRASPAARQLAREKEIDLAKVTGTGPHGAVTRDDVAHALGGEPKPPPPTIVTKPSTPAPPAAPTSGMRQAIAAAMAKSKREIPHYYVGTDVDVTPALAWLQARNADRPVTDRVLFAAVLLKSVALAIRDVPEVNGFFVDGAYRPAPHVHAGVAISLRQGGLVAPALHDVDAKPLGAIMADLNDLVARARAGRLRSSELTDATITVTNLGEQGVESVYGVIYPPQVALVGFGKPTERAWATGGMIGARTILTATLAADHRVSDGHRGARFLDAIARALATIESWGAT